MFQRILAATDGSEHADRGVRLAAELADAQGAVLTIITVVRAPWWVRSLAELEVIHRD